MASIQSLGVGSGLLTSELVEDIIAAEREATDLRLDSRRLEVDARISAFGTLRSELDKLRSATAALSDSTTFLSNTATSNQDTVVTATATGAARAGTYTVEVLSLARAHSLSSESYDSADATIGQGTLSFRFGTTTFDSGGNYSAFEAREDSSETTITIDSTNNTLGGLRDAINAADFGATASIVDNGDGAVLVLRSDATGSEHSLEVVVAESAANPGLSAFAFSAGAAAAGVNLTQIVAADDAVVQVDGIRVRRDNNTINNVIDGVSFLARSLNVGEPATVSVQQDVAAVEARMNTFVQAYNGVKRLADDLTAFDAEAQQGALLSGDSTLRSVTTQLRRFLATPISDVGDGSVRSLVNIGLTTNQNLDFRLEFDASRFSRLLAADRDGLVASLTDATRADDPLIELRSFGAATQAGRYAIEVTQLASAGRQTGAVTAGLAGPVVIDGTNDTLELAVDGTRSGELQLTQASYADGAELAVELARAINADAALAAAGRSVEVRFDADVNQLIIESNRLGSSSRIEVLSIDSATENTLGFTVNDGSLESGQDVAGTVDGVPGTGSGQFLLIPPGPAPAAAASLGGAALTFPVTVADDANELAVTIDGVTTGGLAVPAGIYENGAELAAALDALFNGSAAFTAAGVRASVRFDSAAERLVIESTTTGSASEVRIDAVDATLATQLGFRAGERAIGASAGRSDSAVGGMQLQILGGELGSRGDAVLVRGAMSRLDRFLDSVLSSNGTLNTRMQGLEERLQEINDERNLFSDRMDTLEERLRFQFAAADALIAQLNNTSQFLEQQLAILPSFGRDSN